MTKRCGYVAIVGAPNVGKSTLVNALVGTKVSIVSPKVQTTRFRVLGLVMVEETQIVLVDTPGIFHPRRRFERAMVAAAWSSALDADFICLMIDARRGYDEESKKIVAKMKDRNQKIVLILNKIDLVEKATLLSLTAEIHAEGIVSEIFMVSARQGDGLEDLRKAFAKAMPEGPWLFPDDDVSDLSLSVWAAEITREKAFMRLQEELPYALAVVSTAWEERKDGSVRIDQDIYVQRESQKGIVVGKGGEKIKSISTSAREELEKILGRSVHLFLRVSVKEDWQERKGVYTDMGLDFDA